MSSNATAVTRAYRVTSGRAGERARVFSLVSVCLLVVACSDSSTGVPVDSSFQPPEGFPVADGTAVVVAQNRAFSLQEDTTFEGVLDTIPSDTTIATSGGSFFITSPPAFGSLELDAATGGFTYSPEPDYSGLDSFRYYVVVDGLGSNQATINLTVTNVNDAPELVVELDRVIEQGSNYSRLMDSDDADGDVLVFSAGNLPAWLHLDAETGLLTGQPQQTDVGIYRGISFRVTDPGGLTADAGPFALEVLDVNDPPEINAEQFPTALDAGERVVVNLFPDDPDGDFVILQSEFNDFAEVEILGGSLALTARQISEVTHINLVVIAKDLLGSTSREIIPITIFPVSSSGLGRTLRGRSAGDAGLHLVVLAEGYKEDEANTFRDDVEHLIELMEADPAIAIHFDAWNIHSIMQPSIDSGIDDDITLDFRDTAFDAGYFCRGIQRLICANDALVFDKALDEYPQLDQIVLLVNDPRYGGSGGSIAITSSAAPEIALHELGHSIAGLADEYVDNLIPESLGTRFVEGRYANVSSSNDPLLVPWAHWIDAEDFPTLPGIAGVGIFEGAFYRALGFYRPTSNSRMRENLANFGPVNGEQWALSVYQRTNPIFGFGPVVRQIEISENESQVFNVTPIFDETIQSISWFVDGIEMTAAQDRREFEVQPESGQYTIELLVRDISGAIRIEPPNVSEFRWTWLLNVESL